jgi:hypothetical protein
MAGQVAQAVVPSLPASVADLLAVPDRAARTAQAALSARGRGLATAPAP